MKTLSISIDNDSPFKRRYWVLNSEVSEGCNSKFFEGMRDLKPLAEAKKWAKDNGYEILKVVGNTIRQKDKIYIIDEKLNNVSKPLQKLVSKKDSLNIINILKNL